MGFEFVRSREWQELYNQNGAAQPCHPTQIYEMLYCLVALITSWLMYYKFHLQKQIGLITGVSLLIFFGARFGLEFMKNPQVAEEVNMTLNIGQLLSLPLILLGVYLIATSKNVKKLFDIKFRATIVCSLNMNVSFPDKNVACFIFVRKRNIFVSPLDLVVYICNTVFDGFIC